MSRKINGYVPRHNKQTKTVKFTQLYIITTPLLYTVHITVLIANVMDIQHTPATLIMLHKKTFCLEQISKSFEKEWKFFYCSLLLLSL